MDLSNILMMKGSDDVVRITVGLDDELLDQLLDESKASSKSEAVRTAVTEYIQQQKKQDLLSMKGSLNLENNWQELRSLEQDEISWSGGKPSAASNPPVLNDSPASDAVTDDRR